VFFELDIDGKKRKPYPEVILVALSSHACDYELTTGVIWIDSFVCGIKTISLCPASSYIFSLVRQATSQGNHH
jgi:hypothetical protein